MQTIDLNCDMGEGFANDAQLMPWISSVNIACGYHAGDADSMQRTLALAIEHQLAIGAHPGFADKANFGRTEVLLPLNEVFDLVITQVQLLQQMAVDMGARLNHVKPHGALYNMSARDALLANTIAKAVYTVDSELVLFGLSGSHSISEAEKIGLRTASEVFADRTYQPNGSLTPRSAANALIGSEEECLQQVLQMIEQKTVTATNQQAVPIVADTVCLHGDGEHALDFARAIFHKLQQHRIQIQPLAH
ncbi:MAG: LamB/YcsF family protein [Chitinophagaceae bacterium]|nr:LamB/YcsF family protein [Chitinophagaceae bacterium]MCA6452634.1 LamB/YcsF family protein [Chitinophagaceae bacterium]MCA6459104.1 LamB/YcsF family protein [Chitinophagaceae bacterium]MCA6465634.1 LamB/YcsF family protein [Chitinophagaceae bacterium]MEA3426080.1 5-oxoprolinase subunit PxpA [Bacteroidota bacterium]